MLRFFYMRWDDRRKHFNIVCYFYVVWASLVVNCCCYYLYYYNHFSFFFLIFLSFEPMAASACPIDSEALLIYVYMFIIQDV